MSNTLVLRNCPVCHGTAFRPLPTPGRWIGTEVFNSVADDLRLVRCLTCGLRFASPRPTTQLLDTFYSGDTYCCHEPEGSATPVSKADFLLDQIERCIQPELPRTLLDYGCGSGGFIQHASSRGWQAQGFEPGRRGREQCLRAGLRVAERIEHLPHAQFSLITLHHVFEHLTDHRSVLREIQRILVPGGTLLIEVPNVRSLRARLSAPWLSRNWGFDERHRAFPIHLCYFDARSMRWLLESCGWNIVEQFTSGLGIDELRAVQSKPIRKSIPSASTVNKNRRLALLRSSVRKLVLRSGLGENLCIFARSNPPGNTAPDHSPGL